HRSIAMESQTQPYSQRYFRVSIWGYQKRKDSNEFGAIIGTIKAHLSFLNDPTLCAALENPDFSLKDLTNDQVTSLFVMVPRDFIAQWSSALRTIFLVASKYKARAPQARRITMLVDEAGRMGNFEALLDAFAIGRGEGTRTIALFQDIGQIARNYGRDAISGFLGSAQWRAFFGVRDDDTARLISHMLGNETFYFDDKLAQAEARRQQQLVLHRYMQGGDPFRAAADFAYFSEAARNQKTMPRALMTSDEIINMPEDRMISFISGLNLPPIFAHKYPYYTTRSLNGLWLPNPYHPPLDRVRLPGMFGGTVRRVVTRPVPEKLAHFPQYSDGMLVRIT
ncbi:type IV secretory system conjugative DNA transfer family protein, partial [Novosphingobium album (ex Liu et al. 2023)]